MIDVDVGGIHSSFGDLTDATVEHKPYRHGFFLVVLTKEKDTSCYLRGVHIPSSPDAHIRLTRVKAFNVVLTLVDDGQAVVMGTFITLAFYVGTFTVAVFVSLICKIPISGTVFSTKSGNGNVQGARSFLLTIKRSIKKQQLQQRPALLP